MTNLELADALQAEFPGYEVVDVAAAVLRNLHTENTALRVTEDNLRQELQECQDQRRAAFRRIEEFEEMNAQLREQNTEVDKACAELERQLEEARKDAERYRWLRSNETGHCAVSGLFEFVGDGGQISLKCTSDLDAAIDNAMQKGQS